MNRKELVHAFWQELRRTYPQATFPLAVAATNAFTAVLHQALLDGETVILSPVGRLRVVDRSERDGAGKVVQFLGYDEFKQELNNG